MADLVPAPPLAGASLERLRSLTAQPALRRAVPWFIGAGALGAAALAWAVVSAPPQRQLYAQLDDTQRAGVVTALDSAGIAYSIDNATGALTVAEDQLYRARMAVAADGALAVPDAQTSLDSLPMGASRTLEGERLRTAREHELMLTIKEIDGVESVRVHLAEGNKSVFVRDDAPPTASVMVRMARGRQLAASQVAAIVNLVAASAPGMSPDAVRVVDQQGRLLSDPETGKDNDRIELQTRLETKLRGQIDQLLTPILGPGQFSSEIQIELDMDEVTSARESYDKEGVVRSESQAQSQGGTNTVGGVPGVLANTPPPATTLQPGAPQATVPGAVAGAAPTTESSTNRTYELGREVAVSNAAPGKVKRLSVAVAISQEAMKKQGRPTDIEALKALVSAAVGANIQRGDQVAVLARPFEPAAEVAPAFYEASWFPLALRSLVGLLAVLLVLLLAVRPLLRQLKGNAPADNGADGELAPRLPGLAPPSPAQQEAGTEQALLGKQVELAQRLVDEKPEEALVALRRMLKPAEAQP
ncbi:MAG: flagellar M-ring protein FliF [Sphingomonadaceae bacterium]|nr:flagellar M-ring protein FliF [Sphingomonadaceae bacterium]